MKHIMTYQQSEQGRSMVEMLGSLAIMGVLSAGAIGGYSYAMNKHRTNELIYEATKRAQWVGTQLEMNKNTQNIGFGGFGIDEFGGGKFYGVSEVIDNQFEIQIQDVTKSVCKNLIDNAGYNSPIRFVVNPDTKEEMATSDCAETNKVGLVFNKDLSAADPQENTGGESSRTGEHNSEETVTIDSQKPCNNHGYWNGSSCICAYEWGGTDCSQDPWAACNNNGKWCGSACDCDDGYEGDDCSICTKDDCSEEDPESSERVTDESEVSVSRSVVASISDHIDCNHGYWDGDFNGCRCESGYGGEDCSKTDREVCAEHGVWIYVSPGMGCSCDDNWGGKICDVENPCNGNGTWSSTFLICVCNRGWGGR